MAAPKIIPKKSTIADKVPLPEQLKSGEVSVNWADQAWHGKHPGTGQVVPLGAPYLHSHDQLISLDRSRDLELTNLGEIAISNGTLTTKIAPSSTANRTLTLPDKSGTLATVADITASQQADWNATSGTAQILNKPTLATVATSGSYTDLTNKPTLGTAAATNASAYATAAQGAKADTASQPGHTHAIADVTNLQAALDGKASTAHTHAATDITSGTLADARLSSNVVLTTDSRLTNSRTPTAHASTHATGGSDPITPASIGASRSADVQIFLTSGTWNKPVGAKSVDAVVISGGGGGSSGRVTAGQWGGAGGGGGSYSSRKAIPASLLGSTEAITVGQGGIGGAAVNTPNAASNAGTAGGNSSFGDWVYAGGGSGATGGNGPAGGSATGRNESSGGFGGSGGNGTAGGAAANNGNFGAGGGGGGGGCTTAGVFGIGGNGFPSFLTAVVGGQSVGGQTSGANGANGHTINAPGYSGGGGAGGAGNATGNGGNGGNGGLYGGGGGGGGCCGWYPGTSGLTYSSGKGGDGAQGVVIVITYF